ncbi:MAG TPA: hypothetical protein VNP73_06505, partial [Actinomycetota bacterium]|nr:hypothetical protein [Actinomycetota bacterium]
MRIIFSAVMSMPPFSPGSALHRLHHILGYQELGHDVYFVEETYTSSCFDERGGATGFEGSVNERTFSRIMRTYGLADRSCLICDGGRETSGMAFDEIVKIAGKADLLINMSGHLSTGPVFDGPACRMYLDQDPVYTQLWQAEYGSDLNFEHHDVFATLGLNIGTDTSPIPDCSIEWIHTLPPVVLNETWSEPASTGNSYTTVASWDVFGDVQFRGEWYGSRRSELVRFAGVPGLVDATFEMLVKSYEDQDEGMIRLLQDNGWSLADAGAITDVDGYLSYIAASRGEICIAKNAYAKARSGWFSDRSANYLAAARPVIAQSTGFESSLPTGVGLLSFSSP